MGDYIAIDYKALAQHRRTVEPLPPPECECDVPQPNEEDGGRCLVCDLFVDFNDQSRMP